MIARNILFNALGGVWTLGIAIAAVPLQIHLLGMEAYGVIGFLASLQIILTLLDLGLPTMIIRKVAAEQRAAEATVSAAAGLYVLLGVVCGALLAVLGPVLCDVFLDLPDNQRDHVIAAVRLSGLAFALRWPVAVYAGVLAGMQRMDVTNGLKASGATLRNIGVCAPLFFFPDIRVYAGWMVCISLVELVAHVAACRWIWRGFPLAPRFGWAPLKGTWSFSAGMFLLAGESILLTQSDRLVIGHLRPLAELGIYSVAYSFAFSLSILQGFVTSAMLPAFSVAADLPRNQERLESATELMMLALSLPAMAMLVLGDGLLQLLLAPADALMVAVPLGGLALGLLVNSSISLVVTDAIAKGRIWGVVMVNLLTLPFYLAVLWFSVQLYGGTGAACTWLLLNLSYLLSVPLALRRGDGHPDIIRLLLRNAIPYWLSALVCLGAMRWLLPDSPMGSLLGLLCGGLLHLACGWTMLTAGTRSLLVTTGRRVFNAGHAHG